MATGEQSDHCLVLIKLIVKVPNRLFVRNDDRYQPVFRLATNYSYDEPQFLFEEDTDIKVTGVSHNVNFFDKDFTIIDCVKMQASSRLATEACAS